MTVSSLHPSCLSLLQLKAYHLMNIHSWNQELHAPIWRTTYRQLFASIKCFGRRDLQRQIDADRHIHQWDWIIMEVGMLWRSSHR